jgi:protein import protein ZIM17
LQQNPNQEDGLRNNRDLPDRISKVSVADLNLLSKLPPPPQSREAVPSYAMVFTCKQCSERSAHKVSKQGYHEGTVLITCPGCKSRHLVSDHLKVSGRMTLG